MIYLDSCALLKFIKSEQQTEALRAWRSGLGLEVELVTSVLAKLEISRTLVRAGLDHQRVPYFVGRALAGIYLADLTSLVLERAAGYETARLGTSDAIHLATANPFGAELTAFVTYDKGLAHAAADLGLPVESPA
jgi:uncharacterized protein